jgi:secondary thiamine-phosphate synthase enzyme
MNLFQKEIVLEQKKRGFHLVTDEIIRKLPELKNYTNGIVHIFIKHTSASLTLNENADPDVRSDFGKYFDRLAPENAPYYDHNSEGADDMPAHIKSSLLGNSLVIPITNGEFNLGTWQGIYLCEHRNHGGSRKLVITVIGRIVE